MIHAGWEWSYVWKHGGFVTGRGVEPCQEVGAHFLGVPCYEAGVVPVQPCITVCNGVEATVHGSPLVGYWDVCGFGVGGRYRVSYGSCVFYDVVCVFNLGPYVVGFAWGVIAVELRHAVRYFGVSFFEGRSAHPVGVGDVYDLDPWSVVVGSWSRSVLVYWVPEAA